MSLLKKNNKKILEIVKNYILAMDKYIYSEASYYGKN